MNNNNNNNKTNKQTKQTNFKQHVQQFLNDPQIQRNHRQLSNIESTYQCEWQYLLLKQKTTANILLCARNYITLQIDLFIFRTIYSLTRGTLDRAAFD